MFNSGSCNPKRITSAHFIAGKRRTSFWRTTECLLRHQKPLSAILTLNTSSYHGRCWRWCTSCKGKFGDAYLGVISAVLTLLILVFSEIIPKPGHFLETAFTNYRLFSKVFNYYFVSICFDVSKAHIRVY